MIFLLFLAFAENPKVIYKEKTEIDFEALDIEGRTKKPVITSVVPKSGSMSIKNMRGRGIVTARRITFN